MSLTIPTWLLVALIAFAAIGWWLLGLFGGSLLESGTKRRCPLPTMLLLAILGPLGLLIGFSYSLGSED